MSHPSKLYDELANSMGQYVHELTLLPSTHTQTLMPISNKLMESMVAALRHDNALFNEARFRHLVDHWQPPRQVGRPQQAGHALLKR